LIFADGPGGIVLDRRIDAQAIADAPTQVVDPVMRKIGHRKPMVKGQFHGVLFEPASQPDAVRSMYDMKHISTV